MQALTQFRQHGHHLDVPQLITEALRNDLPRDSPLELGCIASEINSGKRLRFQQRLRPEVVSAWASIAETE